MYFITTEREIDFIYIKSIYFLSKFLVISF